MNSMNSQHRMSMAGTITAGKREHVVDAPTSLASVESSLQPTLIEHHITIDARWRYSWIGRGVKETTKGDVLINWVLIALAIYVMVLPLCCS